MGGVKDKGLLDILSPLEKYFAKGGKKDDQRKLKLNRVRRCSI